MGKIASNLSNDSLPWGRDIESRLEKLEALVASNQINNIARDQRIEANLNRVSEVLSNVSALKTYKSSIDGTARDVTLYATDGSWIDTEDLTITFSIDKPRVIRAEYFVNWDAWPGVYTTTELNPEWLIRASIVINGEEINTIEQRKRTGYATSNPVSDEWNTGTMSNVKTIALQPGDYTVTVDLYVDAFTNSTYTTFFFQNDDLTVSIIE
jgi:hypothetical protein